jgi:hypothetical protein
LFAPLPVWRLAAALPGADLAAGRGTVGDSLGDVDGGPSTISGDDATRSSSPAVLLDRRRRGRGRDANGRCAMTGVEDADVRTWRPLLSVNADGRRLGLIGGDGSKC